MLASFRNFSKSWIAIGLLGLLAFSFVIVGQNDIFRPASKDDVIVAGDREVTRADFKREFDRAKANAEQQMQRPVTTEEAAANGLDRNLLDQLATREAFFALLHKIGVRPSDKLVAEQIQQIPAFFDQITGKFDKALYEQRLAQNNLTPARFEREIRDELAESQVVVAMVHGMRAPRAYGALAAIFSQESRDVGYFPIDPSSVPAPARPTDAQLTQFMNENKARLTLPEFRVLTVVRFTPEQFASNTPIDPAELQKRYEFRRDTVSAPETRTFVQIPAKDQAAAAAIATRLQKGEDPAAVAKANGVDLITQTDKPQSAIPDRKVAAAAFALKEGETSGAIQGDLGFAVVKVQKVTPGRAVSLEEMRPELEAEIRKDAATEKVYELTQTYEDARDSGDDLVAAARKAGVATLTLPPVSQQGLSNQGQPLPLTPKILETAFGLTAGAESDLQDAGNGEYFAVKVDKIIPAALPPLAEVKPQLEAAWMSRELLKALEARAAKFQAELKGGKSLEAVASEAGAKVTRVLALSRETANDNKALSQDALGKAFSTKPGETFIAQNTYPGLIVAKVEAVRPPAGETAARAAEDSRPQMTMSLFQELGESARAAARKELKVRTDYNAARAAIGLEPIAVEKDKPKAAEKAK